MHLIFPKQSARRLLYAGAFLVAVASSASAQNAAKPDSGNLVSPAEVALYVHADLKNTDFIQPLVCALRHVLTAKVSTQQLSLPLGPELLAPSGQFQSSKVANRFAKAIPGDGTPPSLNYLLLPFDMTAESFPYVFSSAFQDPSGRFRVGIVSTARLDAGDSKQAHQKSSEITARRVYKVMIGSIAKLAGLRSRGACILARPRTAEGLDQEFLDFCQEDREALVAAGILRSMQTAFESNCMAISLRKSPNPPVRSARSGQLAQEVY